MTSARQIFWSLYDQLEDHQIDGLQLSEVQLIIKSISPKNRSHWLAWRTGEKTWKGLMDYPEIEQAAQDATPPAPGVAPDEEVTKTSTFIRMGQVTLPEDPAALEGTLNIEEINTLDRRSSTRFQRNLSVLVVGPRGERFTSTTVDLSLEGVQTADPVPLWSGSVFSMELRRGDERLEVKCERTPKGGNTKFKIKENPREDLLRKWLLG